MRPTGLLPCEAAASRQWARQRLVSLLWAVTCLGTLRLCRDRRETCTKGQGLKRSRAARQAATCLVPPGSTCLQVEKGKATRSIAWFLLALLVYRERRSDERGARSPATRSREAYHARMARRAQHLRCSLRCSLRSYVREANERTTSWIRERGARSPASGNVRQ